MGMSGGPASPITNKRESMSTEILTKTENGVDGQAGAHPLNHSVDRTNMMYNDSNQVDNDQSESPPHKDRSESPGQMVEPSPGPGPLSTSTTKTVSLAPASPTTPHGSRGRSPRFQDAYDQLSNPSTAASKLNLGLWFTGEDDDIKEQKEVPREQWKPPTPPPWPEDEPCEYALTVQVRACDDLTEADEIIEAEDSFWSFITGWFGFLGYLFIGALVFSIVEDRDFGDMFWFAVVTTCTVGYGDISPETKLGKVLNGFFIMISIILFAFTFSSTFNYIYARQEALVKQREENKKDIDQMIQKFPNLAKAIRERQREKGNDKLNEVRLRHSSSNIRLPKSKRSPSPPLGTPSLDAIPEAPETPLNSNEESVNIEDDATMTGTHAAVVGSKVRHGMTDSLLEEHIERMGTLTSDPLATVQHTDQGDGGT